MQEDIGSIKGFQSTRPLRGETSAASVVAMAGDVFNPLAPCGARHASMQQAYGLSDFSIHSPLAGRDMLEMTAIDRNVEVFNPLAPCGARPYISLYPAYLKIFQSTRPLRGETDTAQGRKPVHALFNPLAPCGARHQSRHHGHDARTFQSTRPLRGETVDDYHPVTSLQFSIHSPLAGRDNAPTLSPKRPIEFSIHSPLAGRDTFAQTLLAPF